MMLMMPIPRRETETVRSSAMTRDISVQSDGLGLLLSEIVMIGAPVHLMCEVPLTLIWVDCHGGI